MRSLPFGATATDACDRVPVRASQLTSLSERPHLDVVRREAMADRLGEADCASSVAMNA